MPLFFDFVYQNSPAADFQHLMNDFLSGSKMPRVCFSVGTALVPRRYCCIPTIHTMKSTSRLRTAWRRTTPARMVATEQAAVAAAESLEGARQLRVLSGVQPSGSLHLGNYLGAVRQWVESQEIHDNYFTVVDLHAITVWQDRKILAENTWKAVAMYMACGIDPEKSNIFVQSHVAEHTELAWLLNCVTPFGWLQRMIQFKEKSRKHGENASVGLFSYPVLQAADVLLYNADLVPVGEDQRQHIELARDVARRYNDKFCKKKKRKTFAEPKLQMPNDVARIMSLDDATKKMSKSAENDGSRINMTDTPDVISRKVKKCKTDVAEGLEFDNPERPECSNLLTIYRVITDKSKEDVERECGSLRWGQFKPLLADALIAHVDPIRTRYEALLNDKPFLASVLQKGCENASQEACKTVDRVKGDLGFLRRTDLGLIQSSGQS